MNTFNKGRRGGGGGEVKGRSLPPVRHISRVGVGLGGGVGGGRGERLSG